MTLQVQEMSVPWNWIKVHFRSQKRLFLYACKMHHLLLNQKKFELHTTWMIHGSKRIFSFELCAKKVCHRKCKLMETMSKTLNLQLLFVGKMRFFAIEIILRWVAMTSLPKISQPLPNISSYLYNWYDYGTYTYINAKCSCCLKSLEKL